MSRPLKNVTPAPSRASTPIRVLGIVVAVGVAILLCLLFPRVLAFAELAARELRYFWWLVLLVALAAYFFFFFGKKKN